MSLYGSRSPSSLKSLSKSKLTNYPFALNSKKRDGIVFSPQVYRSMQGTLHSDGKVTLSPKQDYPKGLLPRCPLEKQSGMCTMRDNEYHMMNYQHVCESIGNCEMLEDHNHLRLFYHEESHTSWRTVTPKNLSSTIALQLDEFNADSDSDTPQPVTLPLSVLKRKKTKYSHEEDEGVCPFGEDCEFLNHDEHMERYQHPWLEEGSEKEDPYEMAKTALIATPLKERVFHSWQSSLEMEEMSKYDKDCATYDILPKQVPFHHSYPLELFEPDFIDDAPKVLLECKLGTHRVRLVQGDPLLTTVPVVILPQNTLCYSHDEAVIRICEQMAPKAQRELQKLQRNQHEVGEVITQSADGFAEFLVHSVLPVCFPSSESDLNEIQSMLNSVYRDSFVSALSWSQTVGIIPFGVDDVNNLAGMSGKALISSIWELLFFGLEDAVCIDILCYSKAQIIEVGQFWLHMTSSAVLFEKEVDKEAVNNVHKFFEEFDVKSILANNDDKLVLSGYSSVDEDSEEEVKLPEKDAEAKELVDEEDVDQPSIPQVTEQMLKELREMQEELLESGSESELSIDDDEYITDSVSDPNLPEIVETNIQVLGNNETTTDDEEQVVTGLEMSDLSSVESINDNSESEEEEIVSEEDESDYFIVNPIQPELSTKDLLYFKEMDSSDAETESMLSSYINFPIRRR
ncbi:hypothetical protein PCE1_000619 [Barthelona sp. PCE]